MADIKQLQSTIVAFRDERNWKQYHNPKDLAISLSIEASELLENFQWKTSNEALDVKKESIQEEIADVAVYLFMLCDAVGVDLEHAISDKLAKNARKYPIDKAYGRREKYTDL